MLKENHLLEFLDKEGFCFKEEFGDTFFIELFKIQDLSRLITILKQQRIRFEAHLVVEKDTSFELKYFFYPEIPSRLLLIKISCPKNISIPSFLDLYPALYGHEKDYELSLGIKYSNLIKPATPVDLAAKFPITDSEPYEIPVGPIHAGVIEPGHFHFKSHGENIESLSISLGYLKKNIESEFKGRSIEEALDLVQEICGDSLVAYALAYTQAIEKIRPQRIKKETFFIRMILLELERIYNHLGDIGGIINDAGFSFSNSYLSFLKESVLRLNKSFFQNRFLRNTIKIHESPVAISNPAALKELIKEIHGKFDQIIELTSRHRSILDRLSETGHLSYQTAQNLSITGVVGKSSGISFDTRRDLSFAAYDEINFHSHLRREGDVYARFRLRVDEVKESIKIINNCLNKFSEELSANVFIETSHCYPDRYSAWSCVESARGPVFIYLELDERKEKISYLKLRDCSKHNWKALEYAVLKNIIPDFPLCNKSFGLSYSGTDL
jgi:Ni,Fe-hydrogenase III large subunit